MTDIVSNILNKCLTIHDERDKQYGPSMVNFTDIAAIATRLSGKQYTALDVAMCMVATKEARYKYALTHTDMKDQHKVIHDSLVDWINYIAIMENVRILMQQNNKKENNAS